MKKKEKKYIAPNEASLGRWICAMLLGMFIAMVIYFPVGLLFIDQTGSFHGIAISQILNLFTFTCMFVGLVIAIKLACKTSLKDFVLGVGGKINKKECLIVLGLSLVCYFLPVLMDLGHIHMRGIPFDTFAATFLISLALIWAQTTCEELIFRGIFLRWIAKNDIGFNRKSILVAVITSVLFALAHAANPEVTTLSGMEQIAMVCVYIIPGMAYFLMDLYFGNLMPGIIMHFVNNFMLSVLINGEVSALGMPSLMVDTADQSAYVRLICVLLGKMPFVVYVLWDIRKKKKAACAE